MSEQALGRTTGVGSADGEKGWEQIGYREEGPTARITLKGIEADLYTAQGFEALSAGLSAAVNGRWEVPDADRGAGLRDFAAKGELWRGRRGLARDFWADRI